MLLEDECHWSLVIGEGGQWLLVIGEGGHWSLVNWQDLNEQPATSNEEPVIGPITCLLESC